MRRNLMLGLLLLIAPCAFADSVDVLTGTNHAHGYTYQYDFTVDTTTFSFINVITGLPDIGIAAILNGTLLTINKHVGCTPCTTTFIDDVYEHTPYETQIMWEWGPVVNPVTGAQKWELISSASGAYILDPGASAAVPEPSSLLLLACGVTFLLGRFVLRQFPASRSISVRSSHAGLRCETPNPSSGALGPN